MSAVGRAANLVSTLDLFIFPIASPPTFTFFSLHRSSLDAPNRGSHPFFEGLCEQYDATAVSVTVPSICLLYI